MLANDREAGRQFADLFIRSRGAVTMEELERLSDLQNEIEAELRGKLITGELTATGLQQGRNPPEAIHPQWWRRARIDLWASQAQVDETVISDIAVAPAGVAPEMSDTAENTQTADTRRSGVAGRPTSRSLLEAEMRSRAAQGIIHPKLAAEVRQLRDWLQVNHPHEVQAGQSAVENSLEVYSRR